MSSLAWKSINWPLVEARILRYQTRIFKASKENNIDKVRCIQKRLLNSFDAKLVSVRQITMLNKRKISLGLDRQVFITDLQKEKLVKKLRLHDKVLFTQCRTINDLGKTEKYSFDLLTLKEKAKQALCLLALEPEWEAKFETSSYGFRRDVCYHDAMKSIFLSLRNHSSKYISTIDITRYLYQIDHEYLVKKLNTLPEIEIQLKAWLKSGILEGLVNSTKESNIIEKITGTPQGEILSPLLSNIALHGLEIHMKKWISTKVSFVKTNGYLKNVKRKSFSVLRYAGNFVIIHQDKKTVYEAKKEIFHWLLDFPRIKLYHRKTSIQNSDEGFNFLGFSGITIRIGDKVRAKIYPSRKSQELLILKVRDVIQRNRSTSSYNLILLLRPIIACWSNYFKYSECTNCFQKLTHLILQQLRAWVFRRDTRNGRKKIKQRYFPSGKEYYFNGKNHKDNWVLNGKIRDKKGIMKENWLPHMRWVNREKWVNIKVNQLPFQGDNLY